MLRAAIVGLGRWGRVLVESVQGRSDKIRFSAGGARTPTRAEGFASRHGFPLLRSLEEALARRDVDAIVLATPHTHHCGQILHSVRAGKHVFVEKPMVLTLSDAVQVTAEAAAAKVVLCAGHNRRFLPAYRALQELASGELGDPLQRSGNFSWAAAYPPESWRASQVENPAGGMSGLGIHIIDSMVGLGARANGVTVTTRRRADTGLEDTVTALLDCADGSIGTLTTILKTAQAWRLESFGTGGWAAMDGETRLVHGPVGKPIRSWEFPYTDIQRLELEAFADAVGGTAAYPVPSADVLHDIAIFEAICQAAKDGPGHVRFQAVAATMTL